MLDDTAEDRLPVPMGAHAEQSPAGAASDRGAQTRVGLLFRVANPDPWRRDWHQIYGETLEQAVRAEELGFDAIALTEHHFSPDGHLASPLTLGAAIAARTRNVEICTWVALLPLYHPLRLAEQAAVVDLISGGRLVLGLGLGYRWEEYEAFGVDRARSGQIADEALEVVVRAFTEERFSFAGRHFQFEDVSLQPKPYRRPRPPIWMGQPTSPRAVARVARWGLEGFAGTPSPELLAHYRSECATHGTAPGARSQSLLIGHCAETSERAWADGSRHAQWAWSLYRDWWWTYGDTRRWAGPVDKRMIFGDPVRWTERVTAAAATTPPTSHVFVGLQLPGMAHDVVMRSMELFATSVLPAVRERMRRGPQDGMASSSPST